MWIDTKNSFGWISIALHWINAVLILTLLYFGLKIAYYAPVRAQIPQFADWRMWHESIGTLAIPFLVARVVWRTRSGKPKTHDQHPWLALAADTVWRLLLAAVLLQAITGPLWRWWRGGSLEVFHRFEIPTPFPLQIPASPPPVQVMRPPPGAPAPAVSAERPGPATPGYAAARARRHAHPLNKFLELSHLFVGLFIAALLVLHIGGALKHLLVDRDAVLARMLWPRRRQPKPPEG